MEAIHAEVLDRNLRDEAMRRQLPIALVRKEMIERVQRENEVNGERDQKIREWLNGEVNH